MSQTTRYELSNKDYTMSNKGNRTGMINLIYPRTKAKQGKDIPEKFKIAMVMRLSYI